MDAVLEKLTGSQFQILLTLLMLVDCNESMLMQKLFFFSSRSLETHSLLFLEDYFFFGVLFSSIYFSSPLLALITVILNSLNLYFLETLLWLSDWVPKANLTCYYFLHLFLFFNVITKPTYAEEDFSWSSRSEEREILLCSPHEGILEAAVAQR